MKRWIYNATPELVIILIVTLSCFPLVFVIEDEWIVGILFCSLICLLGHSLWNAVLNRGKKYLSCNHSILSPNSIWINQNSFIFRIADKCPQYEFAKEMRNILNEIPSGTVCYCCTHESIKKQILKRFPNAEVTRIYEKNLKRLKKKIKSSRCKRCKSSTCTLLKNENTQFYAIRFKK